MTDPVVVSRFSDPVTITLIGGQVVLIIAALTTAVLSIITHMRVTAVNEQQRETSSQLLLVAKDTEAIKGHVNSEKTAGEGREALKDREITLLREMVNDKKATAGLLAQAAASRTRTEAPPAGAGTTAEQSLQQIDTHTAAIEQNTAKTNAAVQDLKAKA